MAEERRPIPIAESILPYLDSYRKILHVPASRAVIDRLPARGTTMQQVAASGVIGLDVNGCSDAELAYVYSHANAQAAADLVALYFVKTFTSTERMTPVLTKGGSRTYSWPAVLDKIKFIQDWDFPLSAAYNDGSNAGTVTSPRWYVPRWLRAGRPNYRSAAEIKFYLSDTPSPASRFMHAQPDPGEIYWDKPRHRGRIVALHGGVTVPGRSNVLKTFASGAAGSTATLAEEAQRFDATEFRDHAPFVFETDEDFIDGLYAFVEVTIFPPPRSRAIKQTFSE